MRRRDLLQSIAAVGAVTPFAGAASGQGIARAAALPGANLLPKLESGQRLLNEGWAFHKGDIPFPKIIGHRDSYNNAKAGRAPGPAAADYDDSDWRKLDLPHDWVIENPFDKTENPSQGYRARGYGWYRRALRLEPSERGRYLEIQFGAIATNATVWFNGNVVAHNWSGYNSIYIDVTAMARYGSDLNSIVVRVDAEKMEGWWYEGAGIYRHTWLASRSPVHIITDGVYADPRRGADGGWTLPVEVTLYNIREAEAPVEVTVDLLDPEGREVGHASTRATVGVLDQAVARLGITVASPRLWSIENPALYAVRTRVSEAGKVIDERITRAGFRTIRFDADEGFFLNDKPVKLQGVCIHQDHAGVGVAVPDALVEWRVRKLKEMGCNAIRSSHNAPDLALLDACDRMGMLVMDENRLFNITPAYLEQLRWLIRRDRNRPSVILWSVFNEEPIQGTATGYEMVRRMSDEVKELDPIRPVTAAMNGGMFAPVNVSQAVDVVGFNYQHAEYDRFHAANPKMAMTSSEDTSAFISRGEWVTDPKRQVMTSYDLEAARWGATHRNAWKAIAERKYLAGGFVWTGFDYHGEPTPYGWPTKSTMFGIMDLCGFPKSAFFIHQAQWVKDRPILTLMPHWNWPGSEGKPIKVMAATNAQRVRLSLNGKLISEQAVAPHEVATWDVPYAPGRLEAVGLVGGKVVSRSVVETTGAPVALRLTPDRSSLAGDGYDAQPITVEAVDAKGRPIPTANLPVTFAIEGGRIIGLGNGDANSDEASQGAFRSLYNGLAQVIVQTDKGSQGVLKLTATSPGLRSAVAAIGVSPSRVASVAASRPALTLARWRQSPLSATRPDASVQPAESDMNTWAPVQAGSAPAAAAGAGYIVIGARFRPNRAFATRGGVLNFQGVNGRAEVWVDGKLAATKAEATEGPLKVTVPAGAAERTVNVLIETTPGARNGLTGVVSLES